MPISMTFKLTDEQLADSLMKSITERLAKAGNNDVFNHPDKVLREMNWTTKRNVAYLGTVEVSKDQNVAILVNTYNVLKFGKVKRFK